MATVTVRRDGRYEIRESVVTARGPRSRTLATFRLLSEDVLDHAAARALRPFDREAVLRRARALGAPREERPATRAALELVAMLREGRSPAPVAAIVLRDALEGRSASSLPDSIAPALEWLPRDSRRRGEALRDLLRLSDRVSRSRGKRRERALAYPVIRRPPAR